MRIATVLPDVTGLEKRFDYLVPEAMADRVTVGTLVRVELAGRRIGGWVVALADVSDDRPVDAPLGDERLAGVDPARLKPIAKVTGIGPSADIVELAEWVAHRWAGRWRSVLTSASPERAVTGLAAPRHVQMPATMTIDRQAAELLAGNGGVLRLPPNADYVAVVLAALALGPALVVTPSIDAARRLGGAVRAIGPVPALAGCDWATAAAGVDLVVGAWAAVLATVPGLQSIVILDEHDDALQEERNPTWHARDVAIERAARLGIPCLLVSPNPSPAALAWANAGARVATPSRSDERAGWPIVEPIDLSAQEPWVTSLVTPRSIAAVRDPAKRVVCVLNTPGRARRLACRSCRQLTVCEHCGSAVVQESDGALVCPMCTTRRPVVCQHCGASALTRRRPGVTRLREELQAAAGRPVAEITGETPTSDDHAGAAVFVGTEAVLHRVPQADVVAFLDFDAELFAPRYRVAEQAVSLVIKAARLLGPRQAGGRLLVQTHDPQHRVVVALVNADPAALTEEETATRKLLKFPPFAAVATVKGTGADEYTGELRTDGRVTVSGPSDDGYLIRSPSPDDLADALADHPRPPKSRIRIEVDPPRV